MTINPTSLPHIPFEALFDTDRIRLARAENAFVRSEIPCQSGDIPSVCALRYGDNKRLLGHTALHEPTDFMERFFGISSGDLWRWWGTLVFTHDGEDHRRLRGALTHAFTPRRVDEVRPRLRGLARRWLDQMPTDADFVHDFAEPFSYAAMMSFMGVDELPDLPIAKWSGDLNGLFDFSVPDRLRRSEIALEGLSRYAEGLLEERRRSPRDDFISDFLRGGQLNAYEENALLVELIYPTHALPLQLASALTAFVEHGLWGRLKREPTLIARACEEAIRFHPSFFASLRVVVEPFELDGVTFPQDNYVVIHQLSANRDPAVYEDPERFTLDRSRQLPALTFGGGPHKCLGQALVRAAMEAAMLEMCASWDRIEMAPGARWASGPINYGPTVLPIVVR